jgi:VWFA-related protein
MGASAGRPLLDAMVWEDELPVKYSLTATAISALLGACLVLSPAARAQSQQTVPDAPEPQPAAPLPGVSGPIVPGSGAPAANGQDGSSSTSAPAQQQGPPHPVVPPLPLPEKEPAQQKQPAQQPSAPDNAGEAAPAEGGAALTKFVLNVNFVEVPVTVKDNNGTLVAGLRATDFKVYENNVRVPLSLFSVDPRALSIAFVIDQSLTADVMAKVNDSMGAIQGALTPYDEVAVFTYANGPREWTGFTGAQGNRLPAVLALAKSTGTDMQVPINSGPLFGCAIRQNGNCVDPNLQPGRSAGNDTFGNLPKEVHTLNDAILAAAKELSTRPKERLRVIFVVSDGKEYGSKATLREVIRFLQTNKIAVYATAVGASAQWGVGYVSRFHLPFTMYDNILFKYTLATGGDMYSERDTNGVERSYARIAEQARSQYTLGYLSHESIYDGKFRNITVIVNRPNLEVYAKKGYYPSAQDFK